MAGPRDTDKMIGPALRETVIALDPPDSDAALVRLGQVIADTIDGMDDETRGMMLGQTAPMLLKVLQELEGRRLKRRSADRGGRVNKVSQLRSAHAASKRP